MARKLRGYEIAPTCSVEGWILEKIGHLPLS